MVSEREHLERELKEAKEALDWQQNHSHHGNNFYELEKEVSIQANDWILYLSEDELETRVERLEQDLADLKRGEFTNE